MKWKALSVAFMLGCFVAASAAAQGKDPADAFWQRVKVADFQNAIAQASDVERDNNYNMVLAVLYSVLQDQKEYLIYSFRYSVHSGGEAIATFLKRVALRYNSANVHAVIGMTFWEIGERALAVEYLGRALALDAKNPYALNYLSMTYYGKDEKKHLDYSLAAIKGNINLSEAYNNASVAYSALGDTKNAYQMLKDCLKTCKSPHPNTFYNLLNVVGSSGIGFKNRRDQFTIEGTTIVQNAKLDELHDLLKSNVANYRKMIDTCLREAMYGEAQYLLDRIEKDKIDVPVSYYYALIIFQTKNDRDYDKYARRAVAREVLTYEDYYQLASDYFQLSDVGQAIALYAKAQESEI